MTRILAIESSCDETAAAVVDDRQHVLSSVIASQVDVHRAFGGVVPELAARQHVEAIGPVVHQALAEAGAGLDSLDAVAVTQGPGLIGSLLVGVCAAKAIAWRHELPLLAVNHLEGHIRSAFLDHPEIEFPALALIVSGGHTSLYLCPEEGEYRSIARTRDDAAGEAFDKVAKLLGLPYPGGPAISELAQHGNPQAVALPRPMSKRAGLDFSYSGLKTAVSVELARRGGLDALTSGDRADLAASFEAAVAESLVARAVRAMRHEDSDRIAVVGGVAANSRLRAEMKAAGDREGFQAIFPPMELCTDNAVMIAAAGSRLLERGVRDDLSLEAFSRVPLGETPWRETISNAERTTS